MIGENSRVPNSEAIRRELMEAPSHVYFVYSAGLVKIGYSTNWLARTDAVCQGCPHHACVVLVMPGDRQLERGYHDLFHEYHSNGEWFRCEGKMREFIMHYTSETGREDFLAAEEFFNEEQFQ